MTKNTQKAIRSPLFYVGDKYKLMPQLKELFPREINNYYDVFCGGGSASINTKAKKIFLNDYDKNVLSLHKHLQKNSKNMDEFINRLYNKIDFYNLSLSEKGRIEEIEELKKIHKKTYFAKYNKEGYLKLRDEFNVNKKNIDLLYLLLIYGFNHMIRFNQKGEFNLPVGNVDWNKNVTKALINYSEWYNNNDIKVSKGIDFEQFIKNIKFEEDDFIYLDPPYLITFSDYNKLWNEDEENRLYKLLDELNEKGVKWGLSNMLNHKGKENKILLEWSIKYNVYNINSNYISRFDNSIKEDSKEIYVTNY